MLTNAKRSFAIVLCLAAITLLAGCANYEQMYRALSVEHRNLVGLYEHCQGENVQLRQGLSQSQATIEDLQNQITTQNRTPAEATGFEGMDVALDAAEGTITVTLPNTILFPSGSATLLSGSEQALNTIIGVINSRYPGKRIDVVGHTDTDPIRRSPWKDNWELSAQRALSVVRYLERRGLNKSLLRAVGCGDARPVTSNATAAGRARNRRVEIVVRIR